MKNAELKRRMKMAEFKVGDPVRILTGTWAGQKGRVSVVTDSATKGIGVVVPGSKIALVWFEPNELEKENE